MSDFCAPLWCPYSAHYQEWWWTIFSSTILFWKVNSLCRHGWWGGEEGDGQATRWSQLGQSQACHTGHIEEDKVRHLHKSFSLSSFALTLWLSDNWGDIWIVFLACLLVWRLDSAHQGSWSRANKSNSVVERNIKTWEHENNHFVLLLNKTVFCNFFSRFLRFAN